MEFDKQAYMYSGGTICPFCGSTEITCIQPFTLDPPDQIAGTAITMCRDCGGVWKDIFRIFDVEVERFPNGR